MVISQDLLDRIEVEISREQEQPIDTFHRIKLPLPHPLDYDWRFHDTAVRFLLERCKALSHVSEMIVLLGTPSVLRYALENRYPRRMLLLDANRIITDCLAKVAPAGKVVLCDISKDTLPGISSPVVVIDPPWYPESIQLFIWAACQLSTIGGYVLASLPPVGTRPNIEQERGKILDWAMQLGLTLIRVEESALPYSSPPFERNALKTEGFNNISPCWRRGDLIIFSHTNQVLMNRPSVPSFEGEWTEEVHSGIRLRMRHSYDQQFRDPKLESILPGNILPSVSRRDLRRRLVDVWTSGNRVFKCRGVNTLCIILRALATQCSPEHALSSFLKRELSDVERQLISCSIRQISKLVNLERKEIMLYGEEL
jgi:hypothetical protein